MKKSENKEHSITCLNCGKKQIKAGFLRLSYFNGFLPFLLKNSSSDTSFITSP